MDIWKEMGEPHINQYFRLQIIGLTEGLRGGQEIKSELRGMGGRWWM